MYSLCGHLFAFSGMADKVLIATFMVLWGIVSQNNAFLY